MRSYFMGMTGHSYHGSGKDAMKKLYPPVTKHTHNALDDAVAQAEIFALMLSDNSKASTGSS